MALKQIRKFYLPCLYQHTHLYLTIRFFKYRLILSQHIDRVSFEYQYAIGKVLIRYRTRVDETTTISANESNDTRPIPNQHLVDISTEYQLSVG